LDIVENRVIIGVNMWSLLLMCSLSWADTAADDTALEDTALEDTAIEDTADLGDDTSESTDTSTEDTSSTDTSSTDTSTDTSTTDTSTTDTALVVPASSLAKEEGGIGCSTVGIGGILAIWIASFIVGFRKE